MTPKYNADNEPLVGDVPLQDLIDAENKLAALREAVRELRVEVADKLELEMAMAGENAAGNRLRWCKKRLSELMKAHEIEE